MLSGLRLRDFALTEHAEIELPRGLTIVSGETGAGKSVLIQALAFALGAPADSALIRPGATRAEVEAVFDLSDAELRSAVAVQLDEAGIPFDDELIIRRSATRSANGSSRVSSRLHLNDRAASINTIRAVAPLLADIHGQRDNQSLLRPADQLALLDRYAGVEPQRDQVAGLVRRLQAVDRRLHEIEGGDGRERARRIALLRHEAAEIAAAALSEDEENDLRVEHERLLHAQTLVEDAETARSALAGETLGEALDAARRIAELDQTAAPIAAALEQALEHSAEAARQLRTYTDEITVDPARLSEVEARLAQIADMQRRWGDTTAEVIAYGRRAADEADSLESETADVDAQRREAESLAQQTADAAAALSIARRKAAQRFSADVAAECEALRLSGATVELRFDPLPSPSDGRAFHIADDAARPARIGPSGATLDGEVADTCGIDPHGMDRVELYVAFNPGAPSRPLARVASGGETARLTLAIKAVLGERDATPLLVFDEIDVGLGGRSGGVVGERLSRLAQAQQVICITHLPQVAAFARHHLSVTKSVHRGTTRVAVAPLDADQRIAELAAMLGGDSEANRASARDLLRDAAPPLKSSAS